MSWRKDRRLCRAVEKLLRKKAIPDIRFIDREDISGFAFDEKDNDNVCFLNYSGRYKNRGRYAKILQELSFDAGKDTVICGDTFMDVPQFQTSEELELKLAALGIEV